ncbi:MAG: fused signal recognition particle receptor [Chloroflexota bacterium]|jgi:fused signal recognition particle receptor|nr:fused signal recognition particle receptor [Chloroflexota bacterium]
MFWRRKRDDPAADRAADPAGDGTPGAAADRPADDAPDDDDAIANDGPWEPDPADFEPTAAWGPGGAPPLDIEPEPTIEPIFFDAPEPVPVVPTVEAPGTLDAGLQRTRGSFVWRLRGFLGGDDGSGPSWDDVEETLIGGDVGAALAMDIVENARRRRDPGGAEAAVRAELASLLVAREAGWEPRPSVDGGPAILLIVGVNGTGKTTTIGKLATRYAGEGRHVLLAAADTFRAAAIDQLMIWADRAGVQIVSHAPGADPGAVVYDTLDAAVARGADLVIADTAGRLHTKSNLMDELTKIRRIIDKRLPGATPETFFVLDATTGQNGLQQAKAFHESVGLTGIVLTKLDSTAKGGIVFAIEHDLGVPVRFIGVGEKAGDLVPFDPEAFVAALFG